MKNRLFVTAVSALLLSCEKVIDLPLNEADQRIVVEGKLYDIPAASTIKLSKTAPVYEEEVFTRLSGATVNVTDKEGNVYSFAENPDENGTYIHPTFQTQAYQTYQLSVQVEGESLSASSSTYSPVQFDTLDYLEQFGGFDTEDTTFLVFYEFTDNAEEENYYRMIPFVNGERSNVFYLQDDRLFNGNNIRAPFFAENVQAEDTVMAVLVSMDEASYTYFSTLSSNQGSGPFSASPANPVSNIEGNAIGYFSAYLTANDTLVLPE